LTVSAVEATTPGAFGLGATAPTTTTATDADKDMFLQLLVTQMRNQDPANPTDSSEFLAQTAQFTALEKMQAVADQTSQLVALQVAFGASSMVGRTISYAGPDGELLSGVVNSVRFESTGPVLQVNGEDVHFASVQSLGDGTTDLTEDSGDPADTGEPSDPVARTSYFVA
jgi:flagellar basal-body rod modification protein FlgD